MSTTPLFDGVTFDPQLDGPRLNSQMVAVRQIMLTGEEVTIQQVQARLYLQGITATETGISARIRDLRKPRFGGYTVERIRLERGLFTYKVVLQ